MSHGISATLLWSFVALLRRLLPGLSALELSSIGLLIGGVTLLLVSNKRPPFRVSRTSVALHAAGLLVYHLLYFEALVQVPPLEAALINYTWPLLLGLALIYRRIRIKHVLIMLMGYLGVMCVFGVGGYGASTSLKFGHVLAALAALEWVAYSLLIRSRESKLKAEHGLTDLALGCVLAGLLGCGFAVAQTGSVSHLGVASLSPISWVWVLLTGIGPMGLGFWFWDQAMRAKDAATVAALSNFNPILTVFWLVLFKAAEFEPRYLVALVLVIAASILQTKVGER